MLKETYPYYLANRAVFANTDLAVTDKFTGKVAARVALAEEQVIDQAIGLAVAAEKPMRQMPAYRRQQILQHCVDRFSVRAEELARALCIEAGKPIRDSRGEVARLIETFKIAAEEAVRFGGEYMPLDRSPRTAGYISVSKRVPVGACSFITPFNFPLNLAAHKVAPAIAAGCPFVLKPASLTPIGALIIGETLAETDLPAGAFSILPCRREGARLFTEDERLKLLSFTGSPEVGWQLKKMAGRKKVVLELGGNAACIVDEDADLDEAVARIILAGGPDALRRGEGQRAGPGGNPLRHGGYERDPSHGDQEWLRKGKRVKTAIPVMQVAVIFHRGPSPRSCSSFRHPFYPDQDRSCRICPRTWSVPGLPGPV